MLTNDVLIDAFGRVKDIVHRAVEGLSGQELAFRPAKGANSIAWLVWHLSRGQDNHIADVAGHEQVWTAEGWSKKFNLPFDDTSTGYGHSSRDVAAVQVSADQLLGYYDAVHAKTLGYLKALADKDYERVVDTNWDPPVTLAVRLVSVVAEGLQHSGQASYIRGLLP